MKIKLFENLVVGSGITGAVLANLLADKLNEKVLVIDKKKHVAGNIYDFKKDKITVHKYGPHIFHTNNKTVWNYLSKFTSWHYFQLMPKVFLEGHFATLPFNLNTLYEVFSTVMAQKFEEKLINEYGYNSKIPILDLKKNKDKDIQFISNYVYENVFKNYTIKQWGVSPKEIDESVTARVPVYISHDNRYFRDKYQGIPEYGYTKLVENLLNHKNIVVKLNTDYNAVKNKEFKRTFYTGSIDEFFNYKYGQLPYRSLNFDIKVLNKENYQLSAVTNYPNNYDFTRITEHKYFLDEKSDNTIISIEYPQEFILGQNERYYPISNKQNLELYEKYLNDAKKNIPNLYFAGRLGDYKYYNMDAAIERAMQLFEEVCK